MVRPVLCARGIPGFVIRSLFLLLVSWTPSDTIAQTITITAPTTQTTVNEGDDFATQVLQNAWDFNDRRDIGWEEGFHGNSVSVSNGIWKGTNSTTGGYVFPLFGGFAGTIFAEGLPGDTSLPRFGIKHPINASKYRLLAYRLNHSTRSSYAIYWTTAGGSTYWPDGTKRGASFDGVYHAYQGIPNSGYKIYSFDLSNLSSAFEQHTGSWSGEIIALRLDPSTAGGAGGVLEIDWIRLVDPNSAPTINITWASAGLSANRLVTLYVDTDNSGFDGTPIASWGNGTDPGTYALKTAIFPPGDYYFYLRSQGSGLATEATSNYSARLQVTAAPKAVITAPTEITGEDYATTELGNPWDMSDSADIINLPGSSWPDQWRQFLNHSFAGGLFSAVADLPWSHIGNPHTDVQIHMNVSFNKPIDTHKYRYLTYRLWVDPTNFPTISDKINFGWVTRPVFWDASFDNDSGRPAAHIVYEDWHTYTYDLWDNSILESGAPWKSNPFLKHLRIDPLETTIYTWFSFDYVLLSSENRTSNNRFTITWDLSDSDSSTLSTAIYYDTDQSGYDGTLITLLNGLSSGPQSYTWDTTGLPENSSYYVYLVTTDGANTHRVYASVPIVIGEYIPTPRIRRVPFDYDGDSVSDPTVFRIEGGKKKTVKVCTKKKGKKKCRRVNKRVGGSAKFYVKRTTQGDYIQGWGGTGSVPIAGDFDGDTLTDYGVVVSRKTGLTWTIFLSGEQVTYSVSPFGVANDIVAIGDYNGDGSDDIATFNLGTWNIRYRDGTTVSMSWGTAGDRPVPGDYDGDGKTDLAVWRPSDGTWLINLSATGTTSTFSLGQAGDKPVQGDWDADGRTDLAVWRPSSGTWYIYDIDSGALSSYSFGLSGDIPLVGDFDGDGQLDLSVYRPSARTFHHNNRAGVSTSVVHGEPSDLLPLNEAQGY